MKRMSILFARAIRNHPGGAVASVTLMHARGRLISFISLPLERYANESGESGRVPWTPRQFLFLAGVLDLSPEGLIDNRSLISMDITHPFPR